MSPNELRARLQGVVGFPVTPFTADLSLDLEGLPPESSRDAPRTRRRPSSPRAARASSTPSPPPSISPSSAPRWRKRGARCRSSPAPGSTARWPPSLARQAAEAGASGILAFPPYYPGGEDDGMLQYYQSIGSATGLGLIIYSRDWFHPSAALVERLTGIASLIAWKDGQGDIRRLQILRSQVGDRLHWIGGAGDDLVPAYYGIGIRAFTSSVANVSSKVARQLHDTASRGDAAALQALMSTYVVPVYVLRAKRRGYEVSAMKSLMDLLGLAGGPVRPPLANLRPEEVETLRASVPAWKAVV